MREPKGPALGLTMLLEVVPRGIPRRAVDEALAASRRSFTAVS